MSSHRILITGPSGYLGGSLLAGLQNADLPSYDKLYALVRSDVQAEAVKKYGAEPLRLDLEDEAAVRRAIVDNKITIVYFVIDTMREPAKVYLIRALAEVKKATGQEVHFVHTSGAKMFSSHGGAPTDRPLLDTDPDLYSIQKVQNAPFEMFKRAITTSCTVVEEAERRGVRSYVFAPCIVYGKGLGFGNIKSIQTVAIVKAARALKRVYKIDEGRPTWPVCHIIDNTALYIQILRKILNGEDPGHGRNGYFLASSGSVAWEDIYAALASALAKRDIIDDDSVVPASKEVLEKIGETLGCPPEYVTTQIGGLCTFTAEHGRKIGWKPQFAPEYIIEDADTEVQLILDNL